MGGQDLTLEGQDSGGPRACSCHHTCSVLSCGSCGGWVSCHSCFTDEGIAAWRSYISAPAPGLVDGVLGSEGGEMFQN